MSTYVCCPTFFYLRLLCSKVLDGTRIWDATAGRNFSLFLGDIERNKSDVYFSGEYRRYNGLLLNY